MYDSDWYNRTSLPKNIWVLGLFYSRGNYLPPTYVVQCRRQKTGLQGVDGCNLAATDFIGWRALPCSPSIVKIGNKTFVPQHLVDYSDSGKKLPDKVYKDIGVNTPINVYKAGPYFYPICTLDKLLSYAYKAAKFGYVPVKIIE